MSYKTFQVTAHQEALVLIDTGLLPSAQRAAVDSLLTNLRTSVATHLVEAQNILAALP